MKNYLQEEEKSSNKNTGSNEILVIFIIEARYIVVGAKERRERERGDTMLRM